MPRINTAASGHAGPAARAGWQWLAFSNRGDLNRLRRAVKIINSRIRAYRPCNAAFRALPRGRSFQQVWNDRAVWISFDPSRTNGKFGATLGNEITITAFTISRGHWAIAATLIHELAHVNGATGHTTDAEDTLLSCRLRGHHDPGIIGKIASSRPVIIA